MFTDGSELARKPSVNGNNQAGSPAVAVWIQSPPRERHSDSGRRPESDPKHFAEDLERESDWRLTDANLQFAGFQYHWFPNASEGIDSKNLSKIVIFVRKLKQC